MQSNKILNTFVLQKTMPALIAVVFLFGAPLSYEAAHDIKSEKVSPSNIALLAIASVTMIIWAIWGVAVYNNSKKFSDRIISKYIKQFMTKHPDLKIFDKVLYNKKAMNDVAKFLVNSMRESEQKQVLNIVHNLQRKLRVYEKYDLHDAAIHSITTKRISIAQKQILKIINNHVALHPEFAGNLYSVIAHADMIYVPQNTIQQHTR